MKLAHRAVLAGAILVAAFATSSTARAQWAPNTGGINYWLGSSHGSLGGYANFSSPYATGRVPTPPYFALHPPVYYSYPVPRTYGYSPFAYPGIVMTPEVVQRPEPEEITNPYVKPSSKAAEVKTKDRVARSQPVPQMVINPYAGQSGLKAGFELAQLLERPQK